MKSLRTAIATAARLLAGRSFVTTTAELAGMGGVSCGCWMAWHPLGPIVGGALLVAIGVIQAPPSAPSRGEVR